MAGYLLAQTVGINGFLIQLRISRAIACKEARTKEISYIRAFNMMERSEMKIVRSRFAARLLTKKKQRYKRVRINANSYVRSRQEAMRAGTYDQNADDLNLQHIRAKISQHQSLSFAEFLRLQAAERESGIIFVKKHGPGKGPANDVSVSFRAVYSPGHAKVNADKEWY